jgi:ADP-heptose:LPS heptosyltransferase
MRVLAIRPRALGDVVLVTPALRALARSGAGVEVEVLTDARYRPLLDGLPGLSRLWTIERGAIATARLIVALRARRYDRVVDFFCNPRTALITRACGAASTAGYDLRGRRGAYRIRVPRTLSTGAGRDGRPAREYAAATHVRLAVAAGGRADGLEARIALPAGADAIGDRWLAAAGVRHAARAIGLVPAGTWPSKAWPAANVGELARRLGESGREILLLSGPGESETVATVRRHAPDAKVLPPCGVGELATVIARLAAVAGTDSGPKHMAAALGVPTFTWYGPTHPDNWSPPFPAHDFWWSPLPCRGCDLTYCAHWNCMPSLSPPEAARRVLEHVERHERETSALRPAARA